MKSWSAYVQLNGEEISDYYDIEFEVPEKLYSKMQTAIKKGIPLVNCPFYDELGKKAYAAAEAEINRSLRESAYGDKPERSDYDCGEDYEEALEDYLSSDSIDNYSIESFKIFDPGYEANFKSKFIGKTCPDYASGEAYSKDFEYEDDDCCASYYLTVHFDEDGTITDITDISGEALESEDVKSSSWDDCEPDFDFIESCLTEELFGEEYEDDEDDE